MAAVAAPFLWSIAVEAGKAVAAVVGAAISVVAIDEAVEAIDGALDERVQDRTGSSDKPVDEMCVEKDCGQPECPPCVPPVGSIRVERIDWGHPHHPCIDKTVGRAHLVRRNQTPYPDCKCHWDKLRKRVICLKPGEPPPYPMM